MNDPRDRTSSPTLPTTRAERLVVDERPGVGGLCLLYATHFRDIPAAVRFDALPLTLGRSRSASLLLDEHAVSRMHVRIERRANGHAVVDLGSTNGTYVNGERVQEHMLRDGDVLRVGDSLFKYVAHGIDGYARHRIDGAVLGPGGFAPRASQGAIEGGYQVHEMLERLDKIAETSLSVVIHGESGTGKELAAKRIHQASGRGGQFVAINCAALPAELIESELFGYRKGAFSGAVQHKVGLIEASSGGTLFLDEIGDMPLQAQAKLLRVLQEKEVLALGAVTAQPVDLRVVCATHRDLNELVIDERFRGDLMARLRQAGVTLPALRQRPEDLYLLTRHFLEREGQAQVSVDFAFMHALVHHAWPYNVRELESAIRVAATLRTRDVLSVDALPSEIREGVKPSAERAPSKRPAASKTPSEAELRALCQQLHGNVSALSRELGKERTQIHRWLKLYGIDLDAYRDGGG